MSSAMENREFQFPSKVGDAWEQKQEIEREIRSLEKRKKALEKFMKDSLRQHLPSEPDEKGHYTAVVDNVRLTAYNQKYPSYAKAIDQIVDTLVPKTKHDEAEEIIARNSSIKRQEKLSYQEPEEDYSDV